MTTPVLHTVSHAIREAGSRVRHASTIASEMTSHSLSGWDSVTDSDAKRKVAADAASFSVEAAVVVAAAGGDAGLSGDVPSGTPSAPVMGVSADAVALGGATSPPPPPSADAVPTLAVVDIVGWKEGLIYRWGMMEDHERRG
mmetsp:Transcript_970/g.1801  ORF Transcript_970/g.1801 Transcript_970/m.1801 type:complete len:142 (-) Transcript_970:2-427(-)